MRTKLMLPVVASIVLLAFVPAARAGDGCELFGEIAVLAVQAKSHEVCLVSGHPVACAIAAALDTAAGNGLAVKGVSEGCNFVVEKVDKVLKVTITAKDAKSAEAAKKAEEELKKCKDYKVKDKK